MRADSPERRAQVADGLRQTRARMAEACVSAQRELTDVTLIVVTKTFGAADVLLLTDLGVTDVGENRHPEAGRKIEQVRESGGTVPVVHFVGALQTNKAPQVARYADYVHSIDRPKLVDALSRAASSSGRVVGCFVQVDFDTTDPGRAGAMPADVLGLADRIAEADNLRLDGVMTVAPLNADPARAFDRLQAISQQVRDHHRHAAAISAGMSADFQTAIKFGATHVRVGRSVLSERDRDG